MPGLKPQVVAALIVSALSQTHAQPPVAERPAITVAAFEFGAVAPMVNGDYRSRRRMDAPGVYDGNAFGQALGTGAADLVTEKLVASERFRVFERRQLDAVTREQHMGTIQGDSLPRARYVITGSVSLVGNNDHDAGGIVAGLATGVLSHGLAIVNTSQSSTTVKLTARVVDTRTGEVIGSFTGEGQSKKRWGVNVFGMGRGGIGSVNSSDRNFRETALGEAMTHAADAIADHVVALRATTLRP